MCGLLGFASTEGMKRRSLSRGFFMTGFPMVAVDRGMESSGLALVGNPAEVPTIYKKALWGGDFIMHVPVRKYLDDIEKYSVAIGHVRAATSGRGNIN